ncbi:MAG: insulinase family protein, partial [Acidobacteria bacterium]|nr:insulinase family protein [Acidobacteriota bacterium]
DARHGDLVRLAEDAFGVWGGSAVAPGPGHGAASGPADPAPPDVRLALVHRPDATQSELRVGQLAAARHTPDYHALLVLNAILGGQFVSRLNMNLREEKGFTYGVRSSFDFRRGRGLFVVQLAVATSATADAVRESLSEIAAIHGPRPATARELDVARASLTRGYPRSFETVEQIARAVLQMALYDLSSDHFERFVPSIARIGTGEVTAAARAHLAPERAVVAIVGDHARVSSSLSQLGLGEPMLLDATQD